MLSGNIMEIKRFAVHDGDGIRTTVFFKGCPLRCLWCHNPEGLSATPQLSYLESKCVGCGECVPACKSNAHQIENGQHRFLRQSCVGCGACESVCLGEALKLYGKRMTVEQLLPILLSDREFYENSGGGVTLSGGECLLQADFCAELLCALKSNGIHTAVDTCGFVPRESLDKVIPYTDVFLYDLKAADAAIHTKCTGQSNELILENLRYLDRLGQRLEIRIPFVPGYNDTEIEGIAALLSDLTSTPPVKILPYHNLAGSKYQNIGLDNCLPERLPTREEITSAEQRLANILGTKEQRII